MNQAFSVIDSLVQNSVVNSTTTPPATPAEGDCYLVASPASGDWAGQEGNIAIQIGGAWHFAPPKPGMTVYDQSAGAVSHFNQQWESAVEPASPSGGSTIDAEARAAIDGLIEALRKIGVFPDSA